MLSLILGIKEDVDKRILLLPTNVKIEYFEGHNTFRYILTSDKYIGEIQIWHNTFIVEAVEIQTWEWLFLDNKGYDEVSELKPYVNKFFEVFASST